MQCWKILNDFGQFCERIRGIHGNLVEDTSTSAATGINKLDECEEVLEDEIEEQISTEETDIALPMLSIESDLGDDGDPLARRCELDYFFSIFNEILKQIEINGIIFENLQHFFFCFIISQQLRWHQQWSKNLNNSYTSRQKFSLYRKWVLNESHDF